MLTNGWRLWVTNSLPRLVTIVVIDASGTFAHGYAEWGGGKGRGGRGPRFRHHEFEGGVGGELEPMPRESFGMTLGITAKIRQIPERWRRAGLLVGVLGLGELGARIVAPSLDGAILSAYLRRGGSTVLLRLYDWVVGGALSRGAVLALGIMPYLSARILMRLLREASPGLARLHAAPGGAARTARWTRALTVGLALVQSYGFARFVEGVPGVVAIPGPGFIAQTMLVLTAGAVGVMWVAERIAAVNRDGWEAPGEAGDGGSLTGGDPAPAIGAGPFTGIPMPDVREPVPVTTTERPERDPR